MEHQRKFAVFILVVLYQDYMVTSVVDIPLATVLKLANTIDEECKNDTSLYIQDLKPGVKTCPPDGKTLRCYPQAVAGTVVELPCLSLLFKSDIHFERRVCKEDGTWSNVSYRKCRSLRTKEILERRIQIFRDRGINIPEETDICFTSDNGGCQEICISTENREITCSCLFTQSLNEDGKTCKDNTLPLYDGPTNSPLIIPTCPSASSGFCMYRINGNYAWPNNPGCFIQCINGIPNCQCCYPRSLVYSEKCDQCLNHHNPTSCQNDIPRNYPIQTTKKIPALSTSTPSCTSKFANDFCRGVQGDVGSFRLKTDRSSYIVCTRGPGKKLIGFCMRCPEGTVWVTVLRKPDYSSTGYCDFPRH